MIHRASRAFVSMENGIAALPDQELHELKRSRFPKFGALACKFVGVGAVALGINALVHAEFAVAAIETSVTLSSLAMGRLVEMPSHLAGRELDLRQQAAHPNAP